MLNYLFTLIKDNHNLQVRFKWDKNDVALWSNTSSFHNGAARSSSPSPLSPTFPYGSSLARATMLTQLLN